MYSPRDFADVIVNQARQHLNGVSLDDRSRALRLVAEVLNRLAEEEEEEKEEEKKYDNTPWGVSDFFV